MNEPISSATQDIHAYVDGQLAPESRRRVEAWLATNPEAMGQARAYAAIRDNLRRLYDPILREPIPGRLLSGRGRHASRWRRPFLAAAASVFLFLTGTWLGTRLGPSDAPPGIAAPHVIREAAMAYAVFTPESRHAVDILGSEEEYLVTWLSKRMGTTVRAPRLEGLGYRLVGGRLLSSDDGPGALLMYEDAETRRIVLYMCRNDAPEAADAVRYARDDGVSVFYWFQGALSYAVAGALDQGGLRPLAESLHAQTHLPSGA